MAGLTKETLKALIVDDSDDDTELACRALRKHGFTLEFLRVQTAQAVEQSLSDQAWDIVLTDHAMPGLSSHDVIRLSQAVPCIVVSGAVGEETVVTLLKEGAVDFVSKNNLARLGPATERALNETRNHRARETAEQALKQAHRDLERRVEARTAELKEANKRLQEEMDERRRAELELLEARLKLFQFREEERVQLSREIHDGVVQDLLGLGYTMANTERRAAADPALRPLAEPLRQYRTDVLASVRQLRLLIRGLRPPGLAEFGLKNALEEFVDNLNASLRQTRIQLAVSEKAEQLPVGLAECFYRTAQEAVRNALRHAEAATIVVDIRLDENRASLTVQDDGQGFTVPKRLSSLAKDNHFGLIGIDEYAHLVGGKLAIVSVLGTGTSLEMHAPFSPAHEAS